MGILLCSWGGCSSDWFSLQKISYVKTKLFLIKLVPIISYHLHVDSMKDRGFILFIATLYTAKLQ